MFVTHVYCVQNALSMLGIPVWDVLRVLAAVLLLGNIQFTDTAGLELELIGNNGQCCVQQV